MKDMLVQRLVDISHRHRSILYRVVSFSVAICIIMVLMPVVFVWIGKLISRWLIIPCPRNIEYMLAGISGLVGLLMMLWTVWTQWIVGRGGPVPIAPTQKLITSGPYTLCRNPIQLGAFFYVFAFGLIFGDLVVALTCIVLETIIGVAYHKGIEEKELLLRFGEDYQRYKERTPFLIPRIW